MLLIEQDGRIVGGALGFESTLRIIGLEPSARGKGLGRRLVQTIEIAAMRLGVTTISLATEDAKGFYLSMGYHRKTALQKELPLPGRVRDRLLLRLEPIVGDLEAGVVLKTDQFGQIPPLF